MQLLWDYLLILILKSDPNYFTYLKFFVIFDGLSIITLRWVCELESESWSLILSKYEIFLSLQFF